MLTMRPLPPQLFLATTEYLCKCWAHICDYHSVQFILYLSRSRNAYVLLLLSNEKSLGEKNKHCIGYFSLKIFILEWVTVRANILFKAFLGSHRINTLVETLNGKDNNGDQGKFWCEMLLWNSFHRGDISSQFSPFLQQSQVRIPVAGFFLICAFVTLTS